MHPCVSFTLAVLITYHYMFSCMLWSFWTIPNFMSFNESRSYIKGFTTVPTAITVFITTVKIWHFIHLIDFFFFFCQVLVVVLHVLCALSWARLWNEGLYPLSAHAARLPHSQQHGRGRGSYEIWIFTRFPIATRTAALLLHGFTISLCFGCSSYICQASRGWTRLGCAWFTYGNET